MPDLDLGLTREIINECKKQQLNLWECAYVLATAYWETGKTMEPVEEGFYLKNPKAFQKKLKYYPFYGRGLVQLTWLENYLKAGRFLGIDLVKNPALALDPKYSVVILVTGMRKGWFTGVELDDHIDAIDESDGEDAREFEGARKGVNGVDRKKEIAQIALAYERELKLLGYSVIDVVDESEDRPSEPPAEDSPLWLRVLLILVRLFLRMFNK
jgi:putative chitinase